MRRAVVSQRARVEGLLWGAAIFDARKVGEYTDVDDLRCARWYLMGAKHTALDLLGLDEIDVPDGERGLQLAALFTAACEAYQRTHGRPALPAQPPERG